MKDLYRSIARQFGVPRYTLEAVLGAIVLGCVFGLLVSAI